MLTKEDKQTKMKYTIIACMTEDRGLGLKNQLLHRLKVDMSLFRTVTFGGTVIMGRKTWESLPNKYRPLPMRQNIVISSDPHYPCDGATLARDFQHALSLATAAKVFVIGGERLYREALEGADKLILTHVSGRPKADVFFPEFDVQQYDTKVLDCGGENGVEFVIRQYVKKA